VIRVAVVDDQPLLVSAFAALIENQVDMTVVGTGGHGQEAIDLCAAIPVDILLMDVRMPVVDGVEATRHIVDAGVRPRVVILTTFNVDASVLAAVAAGARGFLLKDADPQEVLDAIRAVHRGEAVIASQAAPALLAALRRPRTSTDPTLSDLLTPREIEVLTVIGRGRTNSEVAAELYISETTVKTHVGNLLMKLGARDRVALVILAHSVGLVGTGLTLTLP